MSDKIPTIRRQLSSGDPSQRTVALVLIAKSRIHSLTHEVVSLLEHDPSEDVRAMAGWTLDLLGDPDTVPALISAMYDKSFGVRSNAGWALVHMGRRIFPNLVVPDVIEVLKDENNHDARQMAYLVLTRVGGKAAYQAIQNYWH